jgi:hypothetical protein
MSDQQFVEAVRLARHGEQVEAKRLFVQILDQHPDHEQSWLWLGRILPDLAQRRYCLDRVLKINPENQQARDALGVLSVIEELTDIGTEQPVRHVATPATQRVRRIGDFLVDLGYVTREAVERVAIRQRLLREQGKEFSLGNLLLDASLITHEQLYAAVRGQEQEYQACFT